jgi:hypothetical protein
MSSRIPTNLLVEYGLSRHIIKRERDRFAAVVLVIQEGSSLLQLPIMINLAVLDLNRRIE